MLDRAVEFAARKNDTLILVTADHAHGLSIVGTVDDNAPGDVMRDKVGIYDKAGFPNYPAANGDGYPDRVDVSRRLAIFFAGFPDYYETFRPKVDGPFVPAVPGPDRSYVANDKYKDVPGQQVSLFPFCQSDADWPQDIAVVYLRKGAAIPFRTSADLVEVWGVLELGSKTDPATGFVSQVRVVEATARRA
jgi:alkaline phosphatase